MGISLGILSWGSHKTLTNSLKSYEKSGLINVVEERYIFFQEITDQDIEIAYKYGYKYFGAPGNLGISDGFKALVAYANEDNFLFLENDWVDKKDQKENFAEIADAEIALLTGIDLVRLRSRTDPGWPLWTEQFKAKEYEHPTHLLDSIHWTDPSKFSEITYDGYFYHTTSKNANWTNNPFLAKTDWLKEYIVPRLDGDIEKNIQSWWEQQDFKIAQGNGLFTHHRID